MKPEPTRRIVRILTAKGCQEVLGREGSHWKWTTPGELSYTIVRGREQAPGVLRGLQRTFEPEFGPRWLDKELKR